MIAFDCDELRFSRSKEGYALLMLRFQSCMNYIKKWPLRIFVCCLALAGLNTCKKVSKTWTRPWDGILWPILIVCCPFIQVHVGTRLAPSVDGPIGWIFQLQSMDTAPPSAEPGATLSLGDILKDETTAMVLDHSHVHLLNHKTEKKVKGLEAPCGSFLDKWTKD